MPKNFVGEHFCVPEKFWYRKLLGTREGGKNHKFLSKFLCFTVPKIFVGEPFIVSLISGIESFYAWEGYVKKFDFLSNFFRLTVPKIFFGESLSVSFISAIKKFWNGGGSEYLDFASKFLSHCNKSFHWRTLWYFRKVLLLKIFMHRRRGIFVLSKNFVSQDRNEKLCKRTLRFSGSFLVSKKVYG